MTNLEAIKASVAGYPLQENTFLKVLLDRNVTAADAYTGKTKGMELATADIYMILATAVNVSEGGFSVSVSEKQAFTKQASAIFSKYGETTSELNEIEDATNRW